MTLDSIDNKLLVEQLQQGSEFAYTQLYDLYNKQLYRNILYLVKDEDIAEELLQDLFLKVWLIKDKLEPEKPFIAFLYKVAKNMVLMHFRALSKDQRLINNLKTAMVEYDPHADEILINKEDHQLLNKAIESLPPKRKEIFLLCKIEGKSYEEVGQQLGITVATVNSQVVKANKAIKSFFVDNQDLLTVLMVFQILKHWD